MGDRSIIRVSPEVVSDEPRPDDAAVLVEEVSELFSQMDEPYRSIVEYSMQNLTVEKSPKKFRDLRVRFAAPSNKFVKNWKTSY